MRIQYVATGHEREVSSGIGQRLVGRRIARSAGSAVVTTRALVSKSTASESVPRTGKKKRGYKTRDMKAAE